jgi:hypothetical protein
MTKLPLMALLVSLPLGGCDDSTHASATDGAPPQSAPDGGPIVFHPQPDGAPAPAGDLGTPLPCACPAGFSCDDQGACVGGDPTKIVLDVRTLKLSGTVTFNGAPPKLTAACTPDTVEAIVHLSDSARDEKFDIPVPCSAGGAFDAVVFPGDYDVTVTGDPTLSELPRPPFVLPKLTLNADRSGLVLDVKTVALDGTITLNGAVPGTAQCDVNAALELRPTSLEGTVFQIPVTCANPLAWSGAVYPGSYDVRIVGVGDVASSGSMTFHVAAPLDASADRHAVALDVQSFQVGGQLRIDGNTPSATDCTALIGSPLTFKDTLLGTEYAFAADCPSGSAVVSGRLFAGSYDVSLYSYASGAPLANGTYPVTSMYLVKQDQTAELFNVVSATAAQITVGGTVTLNGHPPQPTASCYTAAGSVEFEDAAHKRTPFTLPCTPGANQFSGQLAPGTYDVWIVDSSDGSDLLAPPFLAAHALVLSADQGGLALDEKTVPVSGRVTLNGGDPATVGTCATGSTDFEGTVRFSDGQGTSFALRIPCSAGAFSFSGSVYPGTYTVSVDGRNGASSLPLEPFAVPSPVNAASGAAGVDIDVQTLAVAGKLTLNGVVPSTTTYCNANPDQPKAHVTFASAGVTFQLPVLCSSSDFSWSGVVFPGVYRVSVDGAGGFSSLPKNAYLALPALKL